jgi:hypothetical protein
MGARANEMRLVSSSYRTSVSSGSIRFSELVGNTLISTGNGGSAPPRFSNEIKGVLTNEYWSFIEFFLPVWFTLVRVLLAYTVELLEVL